MPFERHITEGAGALLDQMGALLQRPRDIAILIAERYRFEPAFRSQAEADLAETIFPEKYNNALLHQPRLTASLYLRSGSDHLAGLGGRRSVGTGGQAALERGAAGVERGRVGGRLRAGEEVGEALLRLRVIGDGRGDTFVGGAPFQQLKDFQGHGREGVSWDTNGPERLELRQFVAEIFDAWRGGLRFRLLEHRL